MTNELFHRNKAGITLLVFVLFSLICLTNRVDPYIVGFKSVIWYFVSPEVVYSGQFFNKLDSLRGRFFKLARAEGENYILRNQNIQLAKRELERDALQEENDRLRNLLELRQRKFSESITAEVIAHDVRDWFYSVVINKGRRDDIQLSAAVVSGTAHKPALVGRVVEVDESTSKVLLITDPVSAVSVSVGPSQDHGLMEGQNKPSVVVRYLPRRSKVKKGDEVKTVGFGGVFPPGVPVGKVTSVRTTPDEFFKEALVQPYLDFGSMQEVLILERKELGYFGQKP